jgi:dipeptidase D
MDMVAEKDGNVEHDFLKDPIETYIDGDWLKAKGTTLGADDGIGISMALAIITDPELQHPAIECLFTVDEETGLTGAFRLKDGMLRGKRLINLDSEDDGQIFIGCAGGIDTLAKMHYNGERLMANGERLGICLSVTGLMGGHSGDDINKGRANANQLLVFFLARIWPKTEVQLAQINGGNLRNAIAREAEAVISIPMAYKEQIRIEWNQYVAQMEGVFGEVEKEMRMELETCDLPELYVPAEKAYRLILALCECPHGMIAMSKEMPGLVETSTNLASVKMKDGYIEVNTSQRSSIEQSKHHLKWAVEQALSLACDEVTHGDGYPGWAPNPKSALLDVTKAAYEELFKAEPQVLAIHAGLECGLFLEKYPYLDMVSIGPQMYGVHSPQERLSIPSTERCYKWLCRILEKL